MCSLSERESRPRRDPGPAAAQWLNHYAMGLTGRLPRDCTQWHQGTAACAV